MTPDQLRWDPLPLPEQPTDFVDGLVTMAGNGSPAAQSGIGVHLYAANASMQGRYFYDADGELLIVPQQGRLHIETELGVLDIEPQEIAVIPRGIRFRVELPDGPSRGYVCENFGAFMRLPDLGPIGSNGLANPRDFLTPNAAFEDVEGDFELIGKFQGHLWRADIGHSPLDVVGWHGSHVPYKYDLRKFNTIGSISYDHPDPSIFLVLTSPTDTPGVGNLDFAIFPPRILAAQDTFRPPWFHRNIASEFMGLVHGEYDAKAEGFAPGGCSLHNCMTGHGPDAATFEKASNIDTSTPDYVRDTMAFMFETCKVIRPTAAGARCRRIGNATTRPAGLACASTSTVGAERCGAAFASRSRGRQLRWRLSSNGVRTMRTSLLPFALSVILLAACNPGRSPAAAATGASAVSTTDGTTPPSLPEPAEAGDVPASSTADGSDAQARFDGYGDVKLGIAAADMQSSWGGALTRLGGDEDDVLFLDTEVGRGAGRLRLHDRGWHVRALRHREQQVCCAGRRQGRHVHGRHRVPVSRPHRATTACLYVGQVPAHQGCGDRQCAVVRNRRVRQGHRVARRHAAATGLRRRLFLILSRVIEIGIQRHRPVDRVALREVDAQCCQRVALGRGLGVLGDGLLHQQVRDLGDRTHHFGGQR